MVLLPIRLIQVRRELNGAGPGSLLLAGLGAYLVFASYITFTKSPDAYYLTFFMFVVCVAVQLYRNDKLFVFTHIQKPHFEMYSEYVVLISPFALSSLLTKNWFCFPLLILALLLIPYLSFTFRQKTYFKNLSALIPAADFEWISGFRRSFSYLIPLYILSIAFSWFRILPLFLLWFITVSVASFYVECEPLHILREGNLSPDKLLRRKLYHSSKYIVLLYAPVLVINTVFNQEYWILNLLFIPVQIALVGYAICLKYSFYKPNYKPVGSGILLSIVSIASIIPYFLPIPLFMAMYYFAKAKNNLNSYLND